VRHSGEVAVTFSPLATEDLPMLATWLDAPHVKRWWPDPSDLASVTSKYAAMSEGRDSTQGFLILRDDLAVGFIQSYRIADEPDWARAVAVAVDGRDAVGIDYLIGVPEWTGRGLGTTAITAFVATLWDRYPGTRSVVVAVQQDNVASWRALERAGFARVWSGLLETDDPSDQGPAYLYVRDRGA
jgi:aminoglycoside 6'-N-acetyltransferase